MHSSKLGNSQVRYHLPLFVSDTQLLICYYSAASVVHYSVTLMIMATCSMAAHCESAGLAARITLVLMLLATSTALQAITLPQAVTHRSSTGSVVTTVDDDGTHHHLSSLVVSPSRVSEVECNYMAGYVNIEGDLEQQHALQADAREPTSLLPVFVNKGPPMPARRVSRLEHIIRGMGPGGSGGSHPLLHSDSAHHGSAVQGGHTEHLADASSSSSRNSDPRVDLCQAKSRATDEGVGTAALKATAVQTPTLVTPAPLAPTPAAIAVSGSAPAGQMLPQSRMAMMRLDAAKGSAAGPVGHR